MDLNLNFLQFDPITALFMGIVILFVTFLLFLLEMKVRREKLLSSLKNDGSLPAEKVKASKKIYCYIPWGKNGFKRLKGRLTSKNITVKGKKILYDPEHLFYENGKLAAFIDLSRNITVPPPQINVSPLTDVEIDTSARLLAIYKSILLGEQKEKFAYTLLFIVVIACFILVGFISWQYTSKIDTLTQQISELLKRIPIIAPKGG